MVGKARLARRGSLVPGYITCLVCVRDWCREFNQTYEKYEEGSNKGTSRNVFHCLCDTLSHINDPYVGGAPQIVGIYRKPNSQGTTFGVIYGGSRYFLGAKIDNLHSFDKVDWRNENFEQCDGRTMKKLAYAQPQPDPLRRP